jgi:DNA-binding MarR family transcriptional regulator
MEPALIAEHASMLRSAVCPILNKFEKQQLITRQEHQDDHRRKIITLTESGSFFAREVKDTCFRVEEKAFARFSTSEIQQMISVFACITQALMEEVIVDEKTEEKYKND